MMFNVMKKLKRTEHLTYLIFTSISALNHKIDGLNEAMWEVSLVVREEQMPEDWCLGTGTYQFIRNIMIWAPARSSLLSGLVVVLYLCDLELVNEILVASEGNS